MRQRQFTPILLAALTSALACDSTTNLADEQPVAIAFSAVGHRTAVADTARVADSLIITRVQLVMSELELSRTSGDSTCATSSNSGPGGSSGKGSSDDKRKQQEERRKSCPEIDLGPFLVNLALSSGTTTRFASNIPAGTYREIEFEIDRADNDSAGVAFIAKNPDFRDISVRAEGTYKGRAFTYVGRAKAELELEFRPSLTVQTTGTVVNIRVDLAKWFRSSVGAVIDPATANPNGPNANLVARNIASSFSLLAGA